MGKTTEIKQLKAQLTQQLHKQYSGEIGRLKEDLKEERSNKEKLRIENNDLRNKNNELQSKIDEYEDWINRLQEFMDMSEDDRKNYLAKQQSDFEVNTRLKGLMNSKLFSIFASYGTLFQ